MIAEKNKELLNQNNSLKTLNQVLEIQIKKFKEERVKVSTSIQKS